MNPEIKQKWIAALRSGKYAQGQGALHKGDKYCCLGVLCEIAVEEGITDRQETDTGIYMYGNGAFSGILPLSVCNWANVSDVGYYNHNGDALAWLNDRGASFTYIADIIEKYL